MAAVKDLLFLTFLFCFLFLKKAKEGQREESLLLALFLVFLFFLEERDEVERPAVLRADSPLLCDVKEYERNKLKR